MIPSLGSVCVGGGGGGELSAFLCNVFNVCRYLFSLRLGAIESLCVIIVTLPAHLLYYLR